MAQTSFKPKHLMHSKHLECCGAEGPQDWQTSKFNNNTKVLDLALSSQEAIFVIPASCCKANLSETVCKQETRRKVGETNVGESSSIYPKGCTEKLVQEAEKHLLSILAIIAGILAIEIFALMVSLCLCCAVGDREDDYKS